MTTAARGGVHRCGCAFLALLIIAADRLRLPARDDDRNRGAGPDAMSGATQEADIEVSAAAILAAWRAVREEQEMQG